MSDDLNHITGTARIATEPKIYRNDKSAVARMFAIINAGDKKTPVNIVAFGKDAADFVEKNVHKGSQISFEGQLAHNEWTKDGQKYASLEIALPQGRSKLDLLVKPKAENGIEPGA